MQHQDHLADYVSQIGIVLGGDLVHDADYGKPIRHSKVVSRWGTVDIVLGVDVDQVDLDRILLSVNRVLRTFRTVRAPVPMQLPEVESDKWVV